VERDQTKYYNWYYWVLKFQRGAAEEAAPYVCRDVAMSEEFLAIVL
jgi:hypothetical protein